jgi:hypothetical protein
LLGTVISGLGFHDTFKVGVKLSKHYFFWNTRMLPSASAGRRTDLNQSSLSL